MASDSELCTIELGSLRRCPLQLRPVKKESLDYYLLRESMEKIGLLNSILVRPIQDGYEVVDGNNRFEAATDLRWESIPCIVRSLTDEDVYRVQLMAQANRIETSPVEYATRLWKIVNVDQTMSVNEVAHSISKSPDWVKRMLGLARLSPEAKERAGKGQLPLSLAVELAKLPVHRQDSLINHILDLTNTEARDILQMEVRSVRGGRRSSDGLEPRFRSRREILDELDDPTQAGPVLTRCKATTLLNAWQAALRWVMSVDENSIIRRKRTTEDIVTKTI